MIRRSPRSRLAQLLILIGSLTATVAAQTSASSNEPDVAHAHYSASRGTLPTEQGFQLVNSDPDREPPTIENNTLKQGPTTDKATQYWSTDAIPLDFSSSGGGVAVEWIVRVEKSTYHASPYFRTGWHVGIRDAKERLLLVFVGTDRVAIVNGNRDGQPVVATFDAASEFHHYRFVVDDELAMLFVDGGKRPLLKRPIARPEPSDNQANLVYFGDASRLAGGQAQLKEFFYAGDSTEKSPFFPYGVKKTDEPAE